MCRDCGARSILSLISAAKADECKGARGRDQRDTRSGQASPPARLSGPSSFSGTRLIVRAPLIIGVPGSHQRTLYEYLFDSKSLTIGSALVCAFVASSVAGDVRLWWRGVLFGYGPTLAAAFFVIAMAAPVPVPLDLFDVLGGFCLEFSVLVASYILLGALLAQLRRCRDEEVAELLVATLILQLGLALPLATSEGFGIFSEGSRIDYLYGGALAKYFTYAAMLLAAAQAPMLAHRISRRRAGVLDIGVVLAAFGASVLAGSKGAVFLWISAVLALVDYRRAAASWRGAFLGVAAFAGLLLLSSVLISDSLGIDLGEFANLALDRFFLSNDARALAFDFRGSTASDAGLLSESFRSISALFGNGPRNPPLGVLLYSDLLGIESGNGANASLAALLTFYSQPGLVVFPSLVAAVGAAALATVFLTARRLMRSATSRIIVIAVGLFSLQQYSQDFLAFQVVAPLSLLAILIVWLNDTRYARSSRRRSAGLRGFAVAERHHPGT
jgi:hypothetical protein